MRRNIANHTILFSEEIFTDFHYRIHNGRYREDTVRGKILANGLIETNRKVKHW